MKRTKFVLIALVAALVLMGAGYAAWSQRFNIRSTVETGELFVQVKEDSSTVEVQQDDGNYVAISEGHKYYLTYEKLLENSAEISGTGGETLQSIAYTLGQVYPGTRFTSVLTFQNIGTVGVETVIADSTSISKADTKLWADMLLSVNGTPVSDANGQAKFDKFVAAIKDVVATLEPGAAATTVTIVMELPLSSGNETENSSFEWNMDFTFEQYNNQ